ncbi:InlB B-repeat-containing protein [Lachnospiraceae bacterium SGI.231]|uniref:InlB B-repeat-containing protein n=1 Tax=Mediterraneibacter faecis TaxID=592978 RepID=UPI003D80D31A
MKKRILSILLICCMVLTMLPATALAEESGQTGSVTASGLCEHHPAHDDECGYTEGTAGTPCSHEHTDDCYTEVTDCVHEHTEDCYPQNSVSGNNATSSNADEPTECTHVCSEESGCITKQLNCQHEHDEDCGYTPATAGTPCGYVCEICGAEDNSAEAMTVERVQAMIDALPDAEEITEDNAEEVTAQLEAIDEAKAELTDEEIDELDITRYMAAAAARGSLAAPMLLANAAPAEQFNLTPGETYWFDLSGANIPDNKNGSLPDDSLHWVPFTYVGTVNAYVLKSRSANNNTARGDSANAAGSTDPSNPIGYTYDHSLFIADYNVTSSANWNNLNGRNLIFGTAYTSGGVDYTLRVPSAGSGSTGSMDSERGTPLNNEWDAILDKANQSYQDNTVGYIKNWNGMYSWGQDTRDGLDPEWYRAKRGSFTVRSWQFDLLSMSVGFRPVLELPSSDTLGSDGLATVTLDLNDGKLGDSADNIQIIVKNGAAFTAPASDGLTRPDGDTGDYFKWLGSDGNLYAPGDSVPAGVTTLTAQWSLAEQFNLTPGGTYWFDLSGENIPGTVNSSVPDTTLHYVPFTYAGTVDAYVLNSSSSGQTGAAEAASQTTDESGQYGYIYPHSLFVADYAVMHTVSWNELNTAGLIFGKSYTGGSVAYTLRAPSMGSWYTGSGDSARGTPQSNEWDAVLDKNSGYIKNWNGIDSWGQDTDSSSPASRVRRGYLSARSWNYHYATYQRAYVGFRPVLEVLNTDALGPDGLEAVTLDLNGGKLGGSADDIQIIVKNGAAFTAPASDGLTRPDGDTGSFFIWKGSNGNLYAPGDSVPAGVTTLTAQWTPAEQFNLTPGGTYWFDLSGENIPGTVNTGNSYGAVSVPDTTLHYVPFTYAGTVDAYKLTSAMATTVDYATQNKYPHSLFVADYPVTHTVSWDELNTAGLIFGKSYTGSSVDYTLRAPSMGSGRTGSGDSERGTPQSNEWDAVLDKNSGYIENWGGMCSKGQDTVSNYLHCRAVRGFTSARRFAEYVATARYDNAGFRPVLEVLNTDTLGSDGLKAVTLDLNGGKLGGSTENIQIVVKNGAAFTAPASDGLTRPDGDTGDYFKWLGSDGNLYAPGDSVPAGVTTLTAQWMPAEQFNLTPGGTYWFDLSGENIPGTVNTGNSDGAVSVPDTTLHYVPFTYAGTVEAYKLTSAMETTEDYAEQNKYPHSLFVADYAVTHTVSWNELNTAGLIFGKSYTGGSVDYTLRAPSVGSWYTGLGDSARGTPQSNEWDAVLDKNSGYIKNWNDMYSQGQDTSISSSNCAIRGCSPARYWIDGHATYQHVSVGFRPVLEVLNTDTLGSDGLKAVTLDLNGGKLGGSSDDIQIIVKNGAAFTAPASDGLTRPDGDTGSFFIWKGSDGNLYVPGDSVPADVTTLTAQWTPDTYTVTLHLNDGTIANGKDVTEYTYGTGATLPTADDITRAGHTFEGWYEDENFSGSPVTEISATDTGKKEFYAKWTLNTYTVTFDSQGGSKVDSQAVSHGGTVTEPTAPTYEGYTFGGWYTEAGCTTEYDFTTAVTESLTLYAKWKDVTCPTGEITVDKSKWNTFFNNITFGLFFKDTQKVTITASDNSGDNVTITYLLSDKELTVDELNVSVFTAYTGAFYIEPNNEYVIYAKLTDSSGNICYINSNGVVLDNVDPLISGIIDGKTYCEAQTVTIDEKYVDNVTVDGTAVTLTDGKFTLSPADGKQTIVVTDKAGNKAEMAVTVNDGHTGGTATCTEKAKCEVCGTAYGEINANNHTDLKHIKAKAATKNAEGNIEYWYCEDCGKYFSDADAKNEITKAATVIAKLTDDTKSPQTGDNSHMVLWFALLFVSCGGVITTIYIGKRKKDKAE